jgi:hypothetical protein
MNLLLGIGLCVLTWTVAIIRSWYVVKKAVWKSEPVAFRAWLATLVFAIAQTFLIQPVKQSLDNLILNNLSLLIANSCAVTALYFFTDSSLRAITPLPWKHTGRWLSISYFGTLLCLFIVYGAMVSQRPEWPTHSIPNDVPEALFLIAPFTFGAIVGSVLFATNFWYLQVEKVKLTRFRVMGVILTCLFATLYAAAEIFWVAGAVYPVFRSSILADLAGYLLAAAILVWAATLLNNRIYWRGLRLLNSLSLRRTYRDLTFLVGTLEGLCYPLKVPGYNPTLREVLSNPENGLYQLVIRILDGQALLSDLTTHRNYAVWNGWGQHGFSLEAVSLNQMLQAVDPTGSFWEIMASYQELSRKVKKIHGDYRPSGHGCLPMYEPIMRPEG